MKLRGTQVGRVVRAVRRSGLLDDVGRFQPGWPGKPVSQTIAYVY